MTLNIKADFVSVMSTEEVTALSYDEMLEFKDIVKAGLEELKEKITNYCNTDEGAAFQQLEVIINDIPKYNDRGFYALELLIDEHKAHLKSQRGIIIVLAGDQMMLRGKKNFEHEATVFGKNFGTLYHVLHPTPDVTTIEQHETELEPYLRNFLYTDQGVASICKKTADRLKKGCLPPEFVAGFEKYINPQKPVGQGNEPAQISLH